ncbi:methyl-accepting chemotaxis protein [Dapis sp. BLCC M126]|uniref:methyl-accepting chemotaxis protein n=1 Tax=Dapis sp. BLCC M126 TaxID=3400189 RepID=UPI003CF5AFA7
MNIQASLVSQTTTTMDELGSSSLRVAEQAETSESGAHQVLNLAAQGTQSVEQAINGINTLRDNVNDLAKQILRLREQTGQIVNISQLVGDIANKTNMLALNVSVEAVRAGEHGKGFSVLAREIRKLADESKKSAEKINILANEIQASMNSTVMMTDRGTKTAIESIYLVENMANAFTGVKEEINNVVVNSQQISLSVKQQLAAVQQVISTMNEINLGVQETASGITQIKTATEELKGESLTLQEVV